MSNSIHLSLNLKRRYDPLYPIAQRIFSKVKPFDAWGKIVRAVAPFAVFRFFAFGYILGVQHVHTIARDQSFRNEAVEYR